MRRLVENARRWLSRPLGLGPTVALAALLCAAPSYLMRDELLHDMPAGDDFVYLAHSRTLATLRASLWTPHNAHVVPWFRLWTYLLVKVAGDLAHLPGVLTVGAYVPFVLVLLAGGHVVAHETRHLGLGLAAMVFLGQSSVIEPALTWYASSQSLWAAFGILAMLAALQRWRASAGAWRMALACLAAVLGAWSWSGGYVAGPVGFVYLWADGRPRCRKAAAIPLAVSLACAGLAIAMSGRGPLSAENVHGRTATQAANPLVGAVYSCQAIPEALVLGNLGLDAEVDAVQGVLFTLAIVALWVWTRRPRPVPTPLEAAGATMVAGGFLLAYTFRSYLPFDSLRTIWVYHAIPHIGFVLFLAGWWAGPSTEPPGWPRPMSRGAVLGVLVLVVVATLLHDRRAERLFLDEAPKTTPAEIRGLMDHFKLGALLDPEAPLPRPLRLDRAIYIADARREAQRLFLARLDRAERVAAARGIDRDAIRRAFGPVRGPGLPDAFPDFDATDFMALPDSGRVTDLAAVRAALGELLTSTPDPPPPWLPSGEAWPPK